MCRGADLGTLLHLPESLHDGINGPLNGGSVKAKQCLERSLPHARVSVVQHLGDRPAMLVRPERSQRHEDAGEDRHVRMGGADGLHALGRGDQGDEA